MSLITRLGLALLVLAVVVAAFWLLRPAMQSAPASATPAALVEVAPPPATPTPAASAATAEATAAVTETAPADAVTPETAAPAAADPRLFQIVPDESEARFIVDEILFGNPNTVVGVTNEVSGTISVDPADPARTTVGPIRVNARALATDNRFRNRSVNRLILQSNRDEYQYITLTPTAISGLPAAATVGEPLNLEVTGDLQIREIVQPVTFAVTVTAASETRLEGLAVGTVQRADFGLTIPNVEGVADVSEAVRLELAFVALAEE
jgi:polyisoprenoid-binding protein YceI